MFIYHFNGILTLYLPLSKTLKTNNSSSTKLSQTNNQHYQTCLRCPYLIIPTKNTPPNALPRMEIASKLK